MPSVLVIEDEAPLSRLICWSLLDAGFEVALADGITAAEGRLRTYQPDVIVFNTIFPDGERDPRIANMRKASPHSRILDVSGEKNLRARGVVEVSERETTADAVLDLPFPVERLIDAIRGLLAPA